MIPENREIHSESSSQYLPSKDSVYPITPISSANLSNPYHISKHFKKEATYLKPVLVKLQICSSSNSSSQNVKSSSYTSPSVSSIDNNGSTLDSNCIQITSDGNSNEQLKKTSFLQQHVSPLTKRKLRIFRKSNSNDKESFHNISGHQNTAPAAESDSQHFTSSDNYEMDDMPGSISNQQVSLTASAEYRRSQNNDSQSLYEPPVHLAGKSSTSFDAMSRHTTESDILAKEKQDSHHLFLRRAPKQGQLDKQIGKDSYLYLKVSKLDFFPSQKPNQNKSQSISDDSFDFSKLQSSLDIKLSNVRQIFQTLVPVDNGIASSSSDEPKPKSNEHNKRKFKWISKKSPSSSTICSSNGYTPESHHGICPRGSNSDNNTDENDGKACNSWYFPNLNYYKEYTFLTAADTKRHERNSHILTKIPNLRLNGTISTSPSSSTEKTPTSLNEPTFPNSFEEKSSNNKLNEKRNSFSKSSRLASFARKYTIKTHKSHDSEILNMDYQSKPVSAGTELKLPLNFDHVGKTSLHNRFHSTSEINLSNSKPIFKPTYDIVEITDSKRDCYYEKWMHSYENKSKPWRKTISGTYMANRASRIFSDTYDIHEGNDDLTLDGRFHITRKTANDTIHNNQTPNLKDMNNPLVSVLQLSLKELQGDNEKTILLYPPPSELDPSKTMVKIKNENGGSPSSNSNGLTQFLDKIALKPSKEDSENIDNDDEEKDYEEDDENDDESLLYHDTLTGEVVDIGLERRLRKEIQRDQERLNRYTEENGIAALKANAGYQNGIKLMQTIPQDSSNSPNDDLAFFICLMVPKILCPICCVARSKTMSSHNDFNKEKDKPCFEYCQEHLFLIQGLDYTYNTMQINKEKSHKIAYTISKWYRKQKTKIVVKDTQSRNDEIKNDKEEKSAFDNQPKVRITNSLKKKTFWDKLATELTKAKIEKHDDSNSSKRVSRVLVNENESNLATEIIPSYVNNKKEKELNHILVTNDKNNKNNNIIALPVRISPPPHEVNNVLQEHLLMKERKKHVSNISVDLDLLTELVIKTLQKSNKLESLSSNLVIKSNGTSWDEEHEKREKLVQRDSGYNSEAQSEENVSNNESLFDPNDLIDENSAYYRFSNRDITGNGLIYARSSVPNSHLFRTPKNKGNLKRENGFMVPREYESNNTNIVTSKEKMIDYNNKIINDFIQSKDEEFKIENKILSSKNKRLEKELKEKELQIIRLSSLLQMEKLKIWRQYPNKLHIV